MTANVILTSRRGAVGSRRFDRLPKSILQGRQDAAVSPACPCPPRPRTLRAGRRRGAQGPLALPLIPRMLSRTSGCSLCSCSAARPRLKAQQAAGMF